MGRDYYFEISKELGNRINQFLNSYYQSNPIAGKNKEFYQPILNKKANKQMCRANVAFLSYCALAKKNPKKEFESKDLIKLCTSIELVNWSTYMINWIYDDKSHVEIPTIKKKTAVSISGLLSDAINITSDLGLEYVKELNKINSIVLTSFKPELETMNITNKDLLENKEKYFDYYKKNYAIRGVGEFYSGIIELASMLTKNQNDKKDRLKSIFLEYGEYLQTLNCLSDFILEQKVMSEKDPSNQFSDIKTNTLTPPIFYMYSLSNEEDKKFILNCAGKKITLDNQKKLLRILFETGTYELLSKEIKKKGRELKREIKSLHLGKAGAGLQQLVTIFESNKIYHFLKDNYNSLKGV